MKLVIAGGGDCPENLRSRRAVLKSRPEIYERLVVIHSLSHFLLHRVMRRGWKAEDVLPRYCSSAPAKLRAL